jgi:hypothetical protein
VQGREAFTTQVDRVAREAPALPVYHAGGLVSRALRVVVFEDTVIPRVGDEQIPLAVHDGITRAIEIDR